MSLAPALPTTVAGGLGKQMSQSAADDEGDRRAGERPVLCLVDDDPGTVDLVREVAQDAGWVAYGMRCLSDMWKFLDGRRPTLLILDDDLPDGRGGDVVRELREDPRMEGVPMLVCTAAHPIRQAEIGAWAPVISKPFDLYEFERHLDACAPWGQSRHAAG